MQERRADCSYPCIWAAPTQADRKLSSLSLSPEGGAPMGMAPRRHAALRRAEGPPRARHPHV